jgi:hypothetical protein
MPDDRHSLLFEPVRIGSLTLPNRLVMAAMGRLGSADGVLRRSYPEYYRRRAEGGIGLIFSEATAIDDPMSEGYQCASPLYGNGPLAAWRAVIEAVHASGGLFAEPDPVMFGVPIPLSVGGYWLGGHRVSSPRAVWHPSAGGSLGWADPDQQLAVAVCHNRMFNSRAVETDPILPISKAAVAALGLEWKS